LATEGHEGANQRFLALKIGTAALVRRCMQRPAISQGLTSQTEETKRTQTAQIREET